MRDVVRRITAFAAFACLAGAAAPADAGQGGAPSERPRAAGQLAAPARSEPPREDTFDLRPGNRPIDLRLDRRGRSPRAGEAAGEGRMIPASQPAPPAAEPAPAAPARGPASPAASPAAASPAAPASAAAPAAPATSPAPLGLSDTAPEAPPTVIIGGGGGSSPSPTPEPSSLLLMGAAAAGFYRFARRRD